MEVPVHFADGARMRRPRDEKPLSRKFTLRQKGRDKKNGLNDAKASDLFSHNCYLFIHRSFQ